MSLVAVLIGSLLDSHQMSGQIQKLRREVINHWFNKSNFIKKYFNLKHLTYFDNRSLCFGTVFFLFIQNRKFCHHLLSCWSKPQWLSLFIPWTLKVIKKYWYFRTKSKTCTNWFISTEVMCAIVQCKCILITLLLSVMSVMGLPWYTNNGMCSLQTRKS